MTGKHGSPIHFREVAKLIGEVFNKKAHVATTHNELIKDPRFVLVGRGLYALKEWGYSTAVVRDVIREILKKDGVYITQMILGAHEQFGSVEDEYQFLKENKYPWRTFGYGMEYERFFDLNELGAIIVKTITLRPRLGSYPHRSTEVPAGFLGSIGLQNVGIERFIHEKLPYFDNIETPLIVSLGGESVEEYVELAEHMNCHQRVDAQLRTRSNLSVASSDSATSTGVASASSSC